MTTRDGSGDTIDGVRYQVILNTSLDPSNIESLISIDETMHGHLETGIEVRSRDGAYDPSATVKVTTNIRNKFPRYSKIIWLQFDTNLDVIDSWADFTFFYNAEGSFKHETDVDYDSDLAGGFDSATIGGRTYFAPVTGWTLVNRGQLTPVPLPASGALLLIGLAALTARKGART